MASGPRGGAGVDEHPVAAGGRVGQRHLGARAAGRARHQPAVAVDVERRTVAGVRVASKRTTSVPAGTVTGRVAVSASAAGRRASNEPGSRCSGVVEAGTSPVLCRRTVRPLPERPRTTTAPVPGGAATRRGAVTTVGRTETGIRTRVPVAATTPASPVTSRSTVAVGRALTRSRTVRVAPGGQPHGRRERLHVDAVEAAHPDGVRLGAAGDVGDPPGDGRRADEVVEGQRGQVEVAQAGPAGGDRAPLPAGRCRRPGRGRGSRAARRDRRPAVSGSWRPARSLGGGHHRRLDPGRGPGRVHRRRRRRRAPRRAARWSRYRRRGPSAGRRRRAARPRRAR